MWECLHISEALWEIGTWLGTLSSQTSLSWCLDMVLTVQDLYISLVSTHLRSVFTCEKASPIHSILLV